VSEARAVRARVVARGRVQGVWFRESTRRKALELGVVGCVRNCDDGSVEAVFEGDETGVRGAVEFMRKGPPAAQVEDCEVEWSEANGEFRDFRVAR
jgi:acylphosphatase